MNIEGRVQKLSPAKAIPDGVYSDREIFAKLLEKLNLDADFALEFLKTLQLERQPVQRQLSAVKNQTTQNKELKATFAKQLFDHAVRMRHNPKLVQLAKDARVRIHPQEAKLRNLNAIVKIIGPLGTIDTKLHLDERVALGTCVLPLGFNELPVHELDLNLINGMEIKIQ